ncbi:unnamed protein product [Sphagnum balticum]
MGNIRSRLRQSMARDPELTLRTVAFMLSAGLLDQFAQHNATYGIMRDALLTQNRTILYSLCEWGQADVEVLALNTLDTPATREIVWSEVPHLEKGGDAYQVIDIWSGKSLGCVAHSIKTVVGVHDTVGYVVGERERMVPNTLTGAVDAAYLSEMETVSRYYGNIITDTAGFEAFWKTVATQFKSNSHVIFDTNNEYHDMANALVASLNQAAITGIRAAGATSQTIFVEGNSYTGAWTWVSSGTSTTMAALMDPNDNIIYEMHQYLDSDGSGTSATCVSTTIGSERSYIFSMEPPSGTQYVGVMPSVLQYI